MADTKVSALTAATVAAAANEIPINEAGTSKKLTAALLKDYMVPRGHIWGLTLSNAADATNDITVAVGECSEEDGAAFIALTGAITKQIDAIWAVGTNAGGMNTGAVADTTWYEVILIKRPDTGVVDVMFSTTANRATVPDAAYTLTRRIGWVRRGASTNLVGTYVDDYFTLTTQINDASVTATATAAAITVTVPPNCIGRFRITSISSTSVNTANVTVISEIVEGNVTPDSATGIGTIGYMDIVGASGGHFEIRVDGSSQIEHDSAAATGSPTFDISTFGWIDRRRRLSAT